LHRFARWGWWTEEDNRADAVGMRLRCLPREATTPVVTDEDRIVTVEGVKQAHDIGHQRGHSIGVDGRWDVALPVATQVRCDGVIAGGSERRQLVTPREPEFGESMQENDQRARACFGHVERDVANGNLAMGNARDLRI
jgi:hypothetical protein